MGHVYSDLFNSTRVNDDIVLIKVKTTYILAYLDASLDVAKDCGHLVVVGMVTADNGEL